MVHGTRIFVNATKFNIWTRRTHDRAAAGERPMRKVRDRSLNLNLILAVSEHVGIVHVYYELIRRTVNTLKFSHFWTPVQIGQSYHCHSWQSTASQETTAHSPFLNPIEEAFSALKAAIKKRLNDADIQERLLDHQGVACNQQALLGHRMIIFEKIAQEILGTREVVNADKCAAFHWYMFTYLPRCMSMQNICCCRGPSCNSKLADSSIICQKGFFHRLPHAFQGHVIQVWMILAVTFFIC